MTSTDAPLAPKAPNDRYFLIHARCSSMKNILFPALLYYYKIHSVTSPIHSTDNF